MARAKKEAALTPEERLQAALVPDWEWPYKLPKKWCWTRIGNYVDYVTDYVANGSFASLKANVSIFKDENYALMVKTQDFANGFTKSLTYTDKHGYDFLSKSTLHGGELILSNIGSVGKVFRVPYFDRPMTLASNSVMVKCYNSRDYDWMYYFLLSPIGFEELKSITTGTAVPKFNKTDLKTIPLPVPPLAEQQRIVDRIESLFAKLDEAKEKAQAVVDSFETRKAAILHKAFTGELTAKWRRTHGLLLDTWKEVAADSLFEYVTSGSRGWAKYYDESGAVFIRMGNLDHGTIELDFSDIQHVKLPNKAEGQRSRIRKNDILISITADVGMVGLVRNDDFEGYINQHIALARPVMSESAEFIAWYLVSDIGLKQMQEKQRGATKVGLSLNDIRALQLKIPLIEEQNEILKVIKMWIGKEQQSQEAAEAVLDQIDLMKKSILARAFRGELGTNDPSEESAVELLKRTIL